MRKVPVLRVLFPLLIGILFERNNGNGPLPYWLICSALCLITLGLILRLCGRGSSSLLNYVIPSALFLLFISAGIFHSRWKLNAQVLNIPESPLYISGIVHSDPEEREKTHRIVVETEYFVCRDSIIPGEELILIYLPKDSLMPVILRGDTWLFEGRVQEFRNNGNPGEFDYAGYMQRKGISHMMFAVPGSGLKLSSAQGMKLKYLPGKIRRMIRSSWDLHNPDLAVLSAITLGDKSMIPIETKDVFVGSGAMHLLAVSGLHVGMIWWVLDLLLVFPRRKSVFRILKVILILVILWLYAGITGFSESVCRSVTMFSLISLARVISRNSNIYNTLFLSAFILLLIDPWRIEEPGFQLSYLAVFGIVSIHPVLERMVPVSNKILKRIRDLVFVSIAAQASTLPVSLLYFHQFPVYFIITNIIAIPLVSILLALFVVFSPFFILDFHPEIFLWILEKLTHLLNHGLSLISALPGSAIREIPMSTAIGLLLILLIFSYIGFSIYKRVDWLVLSIACACCILVFSGIIRIPDQMTQELHIYNFRDYTALSSIFKGQYTDYLFYHEESPDRYVKSYLQSRGKMNRKCSEYHLNEINIGSGEELNFEHLNGESKLQICTGAWGIAAGKKKILVCGGCSSSALSRILERISWDIVVFRKDAPWISPTCADILDSMTCIADASLKAYELKRIQSLIPDLYITSESGAWSNVSEVY